MTGSGNPRTPAWVERVPTAADAGLFPKGGPSADPSNSPGHPSDRLIFIFRAPGCTYARRPEGGCSMCGFAAMTLPPMTITPSDLNAQFDSVFTGPEAVAGISGVDLYNSGSFFADEEMPPEVQEHVFSVLGRFPISRVLVESRPEFIRTGRVREARRLLGSVALEVGIGLESADDYVRERLIRKGFDRPAFERAARALAKAGAGLVVNVLLKPLGLDEQSAIEDAIATGRYVFSLGDRLKHTVRVALQPVFVAPGTPLEREFLDGRYLPASLWSVVAVVRALRPLGELHVGLSAEGLEPKRVPAGCGRCDAALRQALRDFNRSGSLAVFEEISCSCRE